MLKKFLKYYKPHKKLFILDTFCSLVVATCNLFYPFVAGEVVTFAENKLLDSVIIWSAILLGIFLLKAVCNFIVQYWGHVMGVRIQADMRKDFFSHLQKLPFSYFDEHKTGTIMSRIVNDLQDISELAHHGPEDVFLSLITLIGSLVMVCLINPYLALIMLCVVPFMLWFAIKQRLRLKKSFTQMRVETGEVNATVESAISGVRVSKAYTAEKHEKAKFNKANTAFVKARCKAYKTMGIFGSGMGLFSDVMYLVTLVAGGVFLYNGWVDTAGFTSYLLYATSVIAPIRTLTAIFESLQSGMTGLQRFNEVMEQPIETNSANAVDDVKLKGDVLFDNVTFGYKTDSDQRVLNNVSLKITQGQTVALVGPSGGGKTTMCHLIPRFYEIESGAITIDGINIQDMTRLALRKNVGIVAQDVFLFGGTIKENIAYGNLDATDDEIVLAAKRAKIHDFIVNMPDGYDTQVGERGVKLSGGQKQRISIARAFLKNPPILILDEATSALDNVTEMQIQQSLNELSQGRTTLVVAHRLSTIKHADEILVVTADGIKERGTHNQLMEQNGIYAELYNQQFALNNQ